MNTAGLLSAARQGKGKRDRENGTSKDKSKRLRTGGERDTIKRS